MNCGTSLVEKSISMAQTFNSDKLNCAQLWNGNGMHLTDLGKGGINTESHGLVILYPWDDSFLVINIEHYSVFVTFSLNSYHLAVGTTPGGGQVQQFFEVPVTKTNHVITGLTLKGLRKVQPI